MKEIVQKYAHECIYQFDHLTFFLKDDIIHKPYVNIFQTSIVPSFSVHMEKH